MHYDLIDVSAHVFQAFVFDHPVPKQGDDCWYHQADLEIDYVPAEQAAHFCTLFVRSDRLPKLYSRAQLEQGCWAMMASGFDGNVGDLLWCPDLDIGAKIRLIEAMHDLYAGLFTTDPLEHAAEMWWDSFAYDFNPMWRFDPQGNPDHRRIQAAMHETLCEILELPSLPCQMAALHGMNHVQHPETGSAVDRYLRQQSGLSPDERDYALACSAGSAL